MKDGLDISRLVRETPFCIMGISHIHRGYSLFVGV